MNVYIPTNLPDFFQPLEGQPRVWDVSDGRTDRQAGKPHLRRQTDSQHECEPEIEYRFNIPQASVPGRVSADLPTFSPLQGVGQRPGRLGPSGLVQSRLGKRLRYLLLGSPRPQMQGSRLRRGREAPATAAAAARPPSLPPSSSPSLPLSLPRALPLAGPSRGQPVLDQIQVAPKETKKKGPLTWKRKKERPLTAFIFHALTLDGPQFRRPGPGPAAAQVFGACRLAHAGRRAPRAAHSGPPPPQPKHQTDLKVLTTDSTSGRPPRRWPLPRSPLRSVCGQSPHTIHLVRALAPGRTPFLAKARTGHPRAAALPGAANLLPCTGPAQSPVS
ncbi:uncharacterized protein LOC132499438 [Mesoplodon densirostris]|uniref:uncharacterized protein LOC132499438 n=1 Tax=Mesoplodon densirostris TaxID=48708 RepID=UPI0028DBCE38|nr:uncharacterized protein LOC132499438 [Mesoplodon densirostris]